jgi:chemosensory pili system protein ChpA (sensor histidine kinase/response regulator)
MLPSAPTAEHDDALSDLGPLAWVLDELRKSLDASTKAIRRFQREADLSRSTLPGDLETGNLRIARQQLHQAFGALQMVGMPEAAKVLLAMENAAANFLLEPRGCTDEAATCIERASFALSEYLEGVLKGKQASPVALFPQYRAVLELAGADRIHPADLWPMVWKWPEVTLPPGITPSPYSPETRTAIDHAVLRLVKTVEPRYAQRIAGYAAGLAAFESRREPRVFWTMVAGFFESMALSYLPRDLYTKRAASRILQQYALLARGELAPSDVLSRDLAFFCSLRGPRPEQKAPWLRAVRTALGLEHSSAVDYQTEQFGRFDPAQLVLARRRIASAAETWSALAGGDVTRIKAAAEQFAAVNESILRLHPESARLAEALQGALDATVRSGAPPKPAIAMEVATTILYLEAAYEDLDPTDSHLAERGDRLALRLQHVCSGAEPEPMEGWMEELYRRVSDRQTMGSVVDELRESLSEVEKSLDQFFRNPKDKSPLREVPSRLAQMRGVFSVLGLDQPSLAALRMRSSVEQFMLDEIDTSTAYSGIFEKIGNSLGAMGFLIDMLSYQRAMAKKLFVYDEETGEFRPLMGRERASPAQQPVQSEQPAPVSAIAHLETVKLQVSLPANVPEPPTPSNVKAQAIAQTDDDDDEEDMQAIFLEEAREVVQNGLAATRALAADPGNLADQTTLRRAFHTLKGSSRMVGLNDYGEAAWAFEQLLNGWLAEQKPASDELIQLAGRAISAFAAWIEDIANHSDHRWDPTAFRESADAMRLHQTVVPLRTPAFEAPLPEELVQEERSPDFASTQLGAAFEAVDPEISSGGFVSTELARQLDFGAVEFESTRTASFDMTQTVGLVAPASDTEISQDAALDDFDFTTAKAEFAQVDAAGNDRTPESDATQLLDLQEPLIELDYPQGDATMLSELASDDLETIAPSQDEEIAAGFGQASANDQDEQVRVIGDLRLSIPFYNVYLNEADEWSRRLQTELSEWAMELHRPIGDSTVALAHSLLGSSATVGFTALSTMARALEQALEHVKLHSQGTAAHAAVFNDAAEDIRRLLHQFAAGFLKEADEAVLADLRSITHSEFLAPTAGAEESLQEVQQPDHDSPSTQSGPDSWLGGLDEPVSSSLLAEPLSVVDESATEAFVQAPVETIRQPDVVAVASPLLVASSFADEIDADDRLDPDLFPVFQEEAVELLPALGTALRQWASRPENTSARAEALRVLHTLKGSARLAGAMRLGEMAHRLESSIEELGSGALQSVQVEPLLVRFDAVQNTFDALQGTADADAFEAERSLQGLQPASIVPATVAATSPSRAVAAPAGSITLPAPARGLTSQSVRVRSQLLDRLVNQAGEVMISRSRIDARVAQLHASLGELGGNLDRLRQQLRDVEVQAESQMQSRLAQTKEISQTFDPLEFDRFTRVQELTRMMAESVNDVATVQRNLQRTVQGAEDDLIAQGRQARELQRDLLRTRMVEFEGISERLYGVVRQASKEAGKQVKLDIVGGAIDMDRGVLDRMTPSFEHLLRNAVAHGIEDAQKRTDAGKPTAGTITITVHQAGNDVSVTFGDDGGGLHKDRIRARAIEKQLISDQEELTDAVAADLLFKPGFSTAEQVTELSGRGIGMDVVLSEVSALGGRIETTSASGKGTSFKLVLPLTTAVTQVVMLRMGEFSIGVPSSLMETVLRAPAAALDGAYARSTYEVAGSAIPFFWAGALLQVSGRSHDPVAKNYPVAILRSAGQRLALHVDEVLGNREVVVKNLGPQLVRLPGLAGMSVLPSGAVVLIYNPVALATVYGERAREVQTSTHALALSGDALPRTAGLSADTTLVAAAPQVPLILVVDDSITVRRVTQRLLKREGYRVALANDGLQALERLQEERPALVLSDIEMPRMDGFDLLRNIRADSKLADLPVIMITSRIAQKHRDHASELGANHYLGKPYSEEQLLGLIRDYCATATSRAAVITVEA